MVSIKNILVSLCVVFIATNAYAKENAFASSVSLVGMSMDYREYDRSGNILDSEKSDYLDLTGVEVGVDYSFGNNISSYSKIKFNFMILSGDTKYVGSYLGSGQPYGSLVGRSNNKIIDTGISYKYSNIFKHSIELSYGVGLGYREWERSLSAFQVEVYSWYSIRPAISLNTTIKEKVKLGVEVEYQYGFDTKMSSTNPKLDFTLGGANIWEISMPLEYKYNEKVDFFFEATFQKQTIVESNIVGGYYEPQSTAYNNYLKFGAVFKF